MAAICRRIDPSMPARESAAYLLDGLLPVLQEHLFSQHPGELDFDKLVASARARQAALAAAAPKIEAVAAVAAAGSGATPTTDRDLLQRVVNRLDSMAEHLHCLELAARDPPADQHTSRPAGPTTHTDRGDERAGRPEYHRDDRQRGVVRVWHVGHEAAYACTSRRLCLQLCR
jgi:hypothetical protein